VETQPADLYIDHPEVLNNIVKAEVLARIYRAVETLPDGCKKIFEMSYFEELKNPEIAEILEITVNTVKTQKYRAIKILNEKLNPIFKRQLIETTFFTSFFYFL
jgi:RNA polymerase sigma-70 factor (ECF subfamily)